MRHMNTVGLLAALALMSPTAADAGATSSPDVSAADAPVPETLEDALAYEIPLNAQLIRNRLSAPSGTKP